MLFFIAAAVTLATDVEVRGSKQYDACCASLSNSITMSPAEAEPPQAGAAEASPGSESTKPVTTAPPSAPSGQAALNSEEPVAGAGTADNALAGAEAQRETSCGSSGVSFEIAASTTEYPHPTSAGTAAPRPTFAAAQAAIAAK